jgi:hypothetical protein
VITPKLKAQFLQGLVLAAMITGFAFSPTLWATNERFFPVIKTTNVIPTMGYPFDIILLILFVAFSIPWIINRKRALGIIAMASLAIILSQDQMRWQPWVYLYFLMLLPYLSQSGQDENREPILNCLRWVIAGVYFWSGAHKFNSNFIDGTFSEVIRLSGLGTELATWKNFGYLIPIIEIMIGFSLLTSKFRKIGIYSSIIMHIGILFCLSPMVLNHNSVVYPWNVAMIIFVSILFWNFTDNLFVRPSAMRLNILTRTVIVLVWIFPILNLFGIWDHYLSFSLYSNKVSKFYVAIEKSQLRKIDKRFENYFANIGNLEGGQLIDIDKWALAELNVPFYPETRVFKKLSHTFCEFGIDVDKLVFLEMSTSHGKSVSSSFVCNE